MIPAYWSGQSKPKAPGHEARLFRRLLRLVVAFRRRLPVPPTLSNDELRRVDVPMLVLLGQRSQRYDAQRVTDRLRAVVPAARVEVVSGAGHDLPVYCPDLIVDRATEFARA